MLDYNFHFTTPRLIISHMNPANDATCDFIYDLLKHRGIVPLDNFYSHQNPTRVATRHFVANKYGPISDAGFGRYLISLKPDAQTNGNVENGDAVSFLQQVHTHIGIVSMQLARYPGAPTIPDVGFGLHESYQGKGYATEAATGLIKYFQEERHMKEVAGFCDPSNEGSMNCLRRLGFDERGVKELKGFVEGDESLKIMVWTKGVGFEEGALEKFGI